MSNIASQLLQKVKESIQLRSQNLDSYKSSFTNPSSYITATIGGQQEFVPISLLCENNDKYETLLNLYRVFGSPEANISLTSRLKDFYVLNNIEWPADINEAEIKYYVKPVPNSEKDAFFSAAALEKLSNYAGTAYKASDAFLKDLGNAFAIEVVDKTNEWVNSLNVPSGYTIEAERYWQVAGRFKSFTWAKIYKEDDKDKKVFISVGVDVQNKELLIKLDVLRSGTHKLSNFEIRAFDYFTQNEELKISYDLNEISELDLEALIFISNQFIKRSKDTYEQVINFIWNDSVNCELHSYKLFKLSTNYKSNVAPTFDTIAMSDIAQLIVKFEKYMLIHADREELAENVNAITENGLQTIASFETDGKPKTILYQASTGGTTSELAMSREEIEYLGDNLHTYLYQIVEYNMENSCGKLIIRKGSPTKYAELKSTHYTVKIG